MSEERRIEVRDLTTADLPWAEDLIARHHKDNLTPEQAREQGFVQGVHNVGTMTHQIEPEAPGAVMALVDGEPAAILLSNRTTDYLPEAAAKLAEVAKGLLPGKRFYLYGLVLVDTPYRGLGLARRMKDALFAKTAGRYDVAVAYVQTANEGSLRTHEKLGFERIGTFEVGGNEYTIIADDILPAAS